MDEVEIYKTPDGETELEVRFEVKRFGLTSINWQSFFRLTRTSILKHLRNIYSSKELNERSTCAKIAQVRKEGKRTVKRSLLNYNLDAIISVGYRINSKRGTQFRHWAIRWLKEHLVKVNCLPRYLFIFIHCSRNVNTKK